MLKQRILTAIPLAAFVLWGLFTQTAEIIFYALIVVMLISGWEWARLSGITNVVLRLFYALLIAALSYVVQQWISANLDMLNSLLSLSVVFWLYATFHMFSKGPQPVRSGVSYFKILLGVVVLIPPVIALMHIRQESSLWLFYCLSIIWVADIGAYFSGKRFGKNKLAPQLSPGKTREGLYGAVFATALYSYLASIVFELQFIETLMLLIIAVLTTFISVAGDLFFSLLKREQNLKDTGRILPGHGGILDRIDSVTSSAPLLALLLGLVIF